MAVTLYGIAGQVVRHPPKGGYCGGSARDPRDRPSRKCCKPRAFRARFKTLKAVVAGGGRQGIRDAQLSLKTLTRLVVSTVTCGAMAWQAHTCTQALPVLRVRPDLIIPGPKYCNIKK